VSQNNDDTKIVFTFLSTLNHDLRTPLTAMLNMIGLIKEDPQRHCTAENLELIQEAGEELKTLVQDVTDLAKLESGGLSLKMAPVFIREVLDQAASRFMRDAAEKHIDFRIEVSDDVPVQFTGDKDRLQRILSHLISNAVTYTDSGGVIVRAKRIAPHDASKGFLNVRISVEDSGGAKTDFRPFSDAARRWSG